MGKVPLELHFCIIQKQKVQEEPKEQLPDPNEINIYITQMRYLLTLALVISLCWAGRISKGDLWVDYANAGSMTELSFSFMLENPINQKDYIKIALPFPLHSSLVPAYPATQGLSLPLGVVTTYQYVDSSSNIQSTVYTCQTLTQTIDSSNYYIRFYSSDRKTFIPVVSGQWFYLKFKIQQSDPLQYQKSSSILQIQISTVSSVWSNAMVYDDNLAFNYFQLAPAPSQGITLATTPYSYGAAGGYLLTEAVYGMYLDVIMNVSSYQFQQNLKLQFFISQQNTFTWTGTCSSVAKTNAPTIALLSSSLYTCSIDTTKNIMTVILTPSALSTQTSYRFAVNIKNPPIVVTDVDIVVKAIKQVSGVILSYGIDSDALSTNQIYITYQQIFVGWGLRPDALLPFDARIFRGNSATPTYKPYNSLSTKFSISQSTSSTTQLRIQIAIPSQSNAYVLPNGYTHNLPSFPNKQVRCVVEYASDVTNRKIACTGVGALSSGTVYYIGWKMFFPYDNYQSDIDCTQFGLITVYTSQMIDASDNLFILGRGDQFLSYLKSSSDYFVIGRNQSYISYMKTFDNLNMMVLSSDFQQFLTTPQLLIVTNRPDTYTNKLYNDVYVIGQNLAFMTYLQLFSDLYIAYRLKSASDIIKGYDTTPLIATSMPKNTLAIKTCNSKDWAGFSSNLNPTLSSSTVAASTTPTEGLRISASSQSLIFSLQAPYAQVTSTASTSTNVTNNWGMYIMLNPKIKLNGNLTLTESSTSLSATSTTIDSTSSYNQYTLITLKGTTTASLQTSFPITSTKTSFGVYPFLISDFSSIFADDNNMDIMIATVDGIDGPLNKMTFNSFYIINAYTMMNSANITTVNSGYVGYSHSAQMDGSLVPTLLRIKGTLPATTNFYTLNLFFDQLSPYFSNYYTGDIYCQTSQATSRCRYQKGAESAMTSYDYLNYHTFSRIQIKLSSPSTAFDIMIPIKATQGKVQTYFYLGYSTLNAATNQIRIVYMSPMKTVTHSGSYSSSGTFGPVLTSTSLGQTLTPMTLKAVASGISLNSGDSLGGAYLYFSQWDYFGNSTITGWSNGPCYLLSYLMYYTNYFTYVSGSSTTFSYSYKNMKGVICYTDTAVSTSSAQLTIASSSLPTKWGLTLPGYGAYSQNTGNIVYLNTNSMSVPSSATISNVSSIVTPIMGPLLIKSVGKWVIPLPVTIQGSVKFVIVGDSSVNIPFTTSTSTCAIYVNNIKILASCSTTSSPTQVDYILTIPQPDLLPAGTQLTIVHAGMTTNSSYNTITFSMKCYTLYTTSSPSSNQLIFSASAVPFKYGDSTTYIGTSQIVLSSYSQTTNNKAAITQFNFSFSVIGKGLYMTNRVRVDLGQYYTDNSASTISPICKIYTYTTTGSKQFSHDWAAVDYSSGFNYLQFWPQVDLVSTNLTYTVKCSNFAAASTSSATGISAKVVNTSSDQTGQINSTSSISIATLPSLSQSNTVTATKRFTIPSSFMEIDFNVVSPGVTADSIMYIGFPAYYANGLGPDIKCYSTYQIWCAVTDRQLKIRYIGTYTLGTAFIVTVTGVEQPVNYNSGTFYFVIDTDDDPTTVLSSGTFVDAVSSSVLDTQNFPAFQILSFTQSSAYLREQSITITMSFYVPTTLSSATVGQYLFLVFPPNFADVLRFVSPTCTLNIRGNTLKNYISSCTVKGLRLKMPILDDLTLGSVMSLSVAGLINPTNPSSNTYKYVLQFTGTSGTTIIARTFSPHSNFNMPIFIVNPVRASLNYYTADSGLITQVSTTANIQSKQVYIAPSSTYLSSAYSRNVYLSPLNNLYSVPGSLNLLSGQNPYPIRFSALTSGVNYIYFSKTGDGSYYSNLPPLTLSVNKNYFTAVSFVETAFKLPIAPQNSNYSLAVNLPFQLYPMSEVSLTVTLSSATTGILLKNNPTTITFGPFKTVATIALYVNDVNPWIVGATNTLIFTPVDSVTYASGTTIPITAVAATTNTPILTLASSSVSYKNAVFSVKCSEFGRFVYHISRKYSYNLTACSLTPAQMQAWLEQTSLDSLRVNQVYYQCDDILDMVNVVTPNQTQSLTIENLMASTDYTIQGFCMSQLNVVSLTSTLNFRTTSNGGYISKMDYVFSQKLTTAQKIKTVCALALLFNVNYLKVSTSDGYYCSELLRARRLEALEHIKMYEKQQNEYELRVNQQHKISNQRRMLTAASTKVSIYFGINNELTSDTSPATINALSLTKTQINASLSSVVGLPTVVSMTASTSSYIGSNQISNTNVDVGPNYLYVTGMTMPNNGLIYIIVGMDSLWPRAPVISEIKQGSGPGGLPPVFFKVLAYQTSDNYSSYAAFSGLTSDPMKMYIVGSDDNPFDTATFGTIRVYSIQAQVPSWHISLVAMCMLPILLIFL